MKDIFPDRVETVVDKKPTISEKLLIIFYDFCQSRRRVELLAFSVLALMLYGMWKFIT